MASGTGPIKVLHFGLGPIGAAVVKQVAARKGFKIVGAVDIDPAKVGRDLGDVAGVGRAAPRQGVDDAKKAIKATKPDVVVLCTSSSLKKVLPQIEAILKLKVADRVDDRGAGVSDQGEHALRAGDPRAREEGEGRGARHRRQSRVRDGRAADHADRRVRARPGAAHRSRAGRADPAPAVPAEDRRRPDARAVPAQGGRRQRAARGAGRIGVDDCRRARLEARSDHRRDPAAHRDRDRRRASTSPSMPGMSAASSRTASATATACPSSRCTWRRTSGRPNRSTRSRSPGRRR